MIAVTVVRTFAAEGSDTEQCFVHEMFLPIEPARGRVLRLPDGLELLISRVVMAAEVPTPFLPGWRLAAMVRVILESEDPAAQPAALESGWKPAA